MGKIKKISELSKRGLRNRIKKNRSEKNHKNSSGTIIKEQLKHKDNDDILQNSRKYSDKGEKIKILAIEKISDKSETECELVNTNSSVIINELSSSIKQAHTEVNSVQTEFNSTHFTPINDTETLKMSLREIVIKNNFTRSGVNELLKALHSHFPELPLDYRTLLKTPTRSVLKIVNPGMYVHVGIESKVKQLLDKNTTTQNFTLDIFVDGLSIFEIAKEKSFWAVLGRFSLDNKVFPIGFYNGLRQPDNFDELLVDCYDEIKKLKRRSTLKLE